MILEVCVETADAAETAMRSGAGRIELCTALQVGGLTPSLGLVVATLEIVECPVVILVRPRLGNFAYSDREKQVALKDIERFMWTRTAGFAVGGLMEDGNLDVPFLKQVAKLTGTGELVFHRAFDQVLNPLDALEQLVELKFGRILTSGGPPTAVKGLKQLRALREAADDRIEILPAGGIRAKNVLQILEQTNCEQVHGSFAFNEGSKFESRWGSTAMPDSKEIAAVAKVLSTFSCRKAGQLQR